MITDVKLPEYEMINCPPRRGDTLVVSPVYNEMPHLPEVMKRILEDWQGDVLAINDCSTDGSLEALKQFPELQVMNNLENAGAGGVLLRAFKYAYENEYDNVITMDSDGQHSTECIDTFLQEMKKCRCCPKCNFVWGSRYAQGYGRVADEFRGRQAINREITTRLNEVTGFELSDAFCGFRAYHTKSLCKLNITETGYGMFLQMTIQAAREGMCIRQIPIPLIYLDDTRDFNGNFSDQQERLSYYHRVIDAELAKESSIREPQPCCKEQN